MTAFVYGGVAKYFNSALAVGTTPAITAQLYVPANTLSAGSSFRVSVAGILTAAETMTVSFWYGPTGVISGGTPDPKIWAGVATGSFTGQYSDMECTCQSTGSSGTFYVSGLAGGGVAAATYIAGTTTGAANVYMPTTTTGTTGNTTTSNIFTVAIATGGTTTLAVRTCQIEGLW